MSEPSRESNADRRDFLRSLGEGLMAVSNDEDAHGELASALANKDEASFRRALTRIPLPDSPAVGRFVCRTIGYEQEPGQWVWVCRWTNSGIVYGGPPKKLKPAQQAELKLLAKAETPQEILDRLIRMGLVSCGWEYEEGDLVPIEWCDLVFGPDRPPKPGPGPDPFGKGE